MASNPPFTPKNAPIPAASFTSPAPEFVYEYMANMTAKHDKHPANASENEWLTTIVFGKKVQIPPHNNPARTIVYVATLGILRDLRSCQVTQARPLRRPPNTTGSATDAIWMKMTNHPIDEPEISPHFFFNHSKAVFPNAISATTAMAATANIITLLNVLDSPR